MCLRHVLFSQSFNDTLVGAGILSGTNLLLVVSQNGISVILDFILTGNSINPLNFITKFLFNQDSTVYECLEG